MRQALGGDVGVACSAAAPEGQRDHRPQQARRAFLGRGVERGHGERLPEALEGGLGGVEDVGDGGVRASARQA